MVLVILLEPKQTRKSFSKVSSTVKMIATIEWQKNKDLEPDQLSNFGKLMRNSISSRMLKEPWIFALLLEVGLKF